MPSNFIYDPIIYSPSSALSVWNINHDFGRHVNVALYDASGVEMEADIFESSLNTVVISFYERGLLMSVIGTAVIS